MSKERTHAFLADGSRRAAGVTGGTAERRRDLESDLVFLSDRFFPDAAFQAEMRCHSWDAGLAASQSGDDALLKGPKAKQYVVRDEMSMEYAVKHDRRSVTCLPAAEGPASYLGVTWEEINKELGKYGARISEALPTCLSLCVVPSDETQINKLHVIEDDGEERTADVEVPRYFTVFLVNSSPLMLTNIEITFGGYGTVDEQHWQRPTESMRRFLEPETAIEIEVLTVGELDFRNWYEIEVASPLADTRTLTKTVSGRDFVPDQLTQVPALNREAYEFTLKVRDHEPSQVP